MNKTKLKNIIVFAFIFSAVFFTAFYAFADEFLLSAPSTAEGRTSDFIPLLHWLLKFLFFAVSILAVLMIVIGGTLYIAAGAAGNPEKIADAKNRILYAVGGVVLALSSWLILNTINPDLLELDLALPELIINQAPGTGSTSGTGTRTESTCADYTNESDCNNNPVNIQTANGCKWENNRCSLNNQTAQLDVVWSEFSCTGNYSRQVDNDLCPQPKPNEMRFCCEKVR